MLVFVDGKHFWIFAYLFIADGELPLGFLVALGEGLEFFDGFGLKDFC